MTWTPARMALVTGALFVALVGVGVHYVVNVAPAQQAARERAEEAERAQQAAAGRARTSTPAASPSVSATPSAPGGSEPTPSAAPRTRRSPSPKPVDVATALPLPLPLPGVVPQPSLDFTISTFNVLGASHSRRRGVAPGRVRAGRAVQILRAHGADVVGFQELQDPQLAVLSRRTGFDFFPGFEMRDGENSIGWRRDLFTAVEKRTVRIPYFNGGVRRMPFVRLRHLETRLEFWVANFHNPADTYRFKRQQRFRDRATSIEIKLANALQRTRLPVFVTGDMNERSRYFCRFTGGTSMVAARGGSNGPDGCRPGNPRVIDWIFASRGVQVTDYFEDRSRLVDITTDHPVISAKVRVTGLPLGG